MKKIIFTSMIAIFLLGACNTLNNDDDAARDNRDKRVEQTRYKDNRNNGTNNHRVANDERARDRDREDRYDVSKEAAEAITDEIPEVNQAYVLTTRNNAYVAAMFDDDQSDRTDDDNWRNETDRNRGNIDDNRRNDDQARGTDDTNTNRSDMTTDESDRLTDDLKDRIASIVREHNDDIKNVYVTTNPEFSNLARDYMDDVDNGEPISGFFDQIGSMIERIFPQNKR